MHIPIQYIVAPPEKIWGLGIWRGGGHLPQMVRPIMEYAADIWDPIHKSNIQQLEKVQRGAAIDGS